MLHTQRLQLCAYSGCLHALIWLISLSIAHWLRVQKAMVCVAPVLSVVGLRFTTVKTNLILFLNTEEEKIFFLVFSFAYEEFCTATTKRAKTDLGWHILLVNITKTMGHDVSVLSRLFYFWIYISFLNTYCNPRAILWAQHVIIQYFLWFSN